MLRNDAVPDEGVIRKIQNLLELAKHATANENEAATAMALAQQLLARYNLDLQIVENTRVAGGAAANTPEKREKQPTSYRVAYPWQNKLWKVLAETNFCAMWVYEATEYYQGKPYKGKRVVLLGKESNVTTVRLMGEYFVDTIKRLLPYQNGDHNSRSAHSWKEGCVDRLAERMEAKFEEMKWEDSAHDCAGYTAAPGTALVVRSIYEAEQAANYDARWGDGAWARQQANDAEWNAGYETRMAKRKQEREEEEAKVAAARTLESLVDKARREKKEAAEAARQERANARYSEQYWNRQEREESKRDHSAYRAGAEVGDEIGINQQVGSGKTAKQLA